MTTITKSIITDFGGLVNISQFQDLIFASGIININTRLSSIFIDGDDMIISFTDTLSPSEISIINNIITNYVYQSPNPNPEIVSIYVDGAISGDLSMAIISGTSSGGNVVFSALNKQSQPIFESIIAKSAVLTSFSTTQAFIFGTPTLATDKQTISVPIRVQNTTSTVILGISVLSGSSFVNPPNGTTVNLTIYGFKYHS